MAEYVWELPAESPSPTEETSTSENVDHAEAAVNRLPQQFRKPKIEKLLRIFCKPMAALEQAFIDLLTKRTVGTAEGEQLNVLGRIVGQKPVDVTETTYRSLISARITANKSSGLGNQVLRVSRAVLTDYANQEDVVAAGVMSIELTPYYPAHFVIRIHNIDLPWDLAELLAETFLEVIAATGVGSSVEFVPWEDPNVSDHDSTFVLSSSDDETLGDGEGFSDASDPTGDGGFLSAVVT